MYKWILAFIGLYIFRLPGFFIGMFIGHQIDKNNFTKLGNSIKKEFELNLLALASILIKSDGEVSKQELQFVRNYFISIYGQYRANILFKEFNTNIDKKNISAKQICNFFLKRTTYGTRLQLIHFLFNIAKADGSISKAEIEKLLEFTQLLNISSYRTSLNLNAIENNIQSVSQSHFYGVRDKVIPKELYTNYQERNLNNSCIKFIKVDATHNKRWELFWQNNSNIKVNC